jgi:hypothetical protein
MMKKKPAARLTLHEGTERSKLGKTKTNKKQQYEQKCQSHTCLGTINSSMYDSDLTTTMWSFVQWTFSKNAEAQRER